MPRAGILASRHASPLAAHSRARAAGALGQRRELPRAVRRSRFHDGVDAASKVV